MLVSYAAKKNRKSDNNPAARIHFLLDELGRISNGSQLLDTLNKEGIWRHEDGRRRILVSAHLIAEVIPRIEKFISERKVKSISDEYRSTLMNYIFTIQKFIPLKTLSEDTFFGRYIKRDPQLKSVFIDKNASLPEYLEADVKRAKEEIDEMNRQIKLLK